MSLKETRKKGSRTLISIAVIAIAVYFGFEPLISFVPDGIAKSVISSSFGAIFVIILTMYLLNKQTEIEQESKKSERVFDEKVQLFREIMDITRDMLIDGTISKEEVNKLPFPLIRLQMLANDETIKSFASVNQQLNEIYASDAADDVLIPEDAKTELYQALSKFASQCRLDLGISDRDVGEDLVESAVETITNTGKKGRDMSKMSFDGNDFPKNRYVWEVLNSHVKENSNISLKDFEKLFPRDGGEEFKKAGIKKGGTYETWKTFDEAMEVLERTGRKRFHFGKDKDMVLNIDGNEICISSAWTSEHMKPFVERMKSKGVRTE